MKFAYIRKKRAYSYLAFEGTPENHKKNNYIKKEFYTRLMAIRYLKKHGYELVLRDRKNSMYYTEKTVKVKHEVYIVKDKIKIRLLKPV